MSDDEGATTEEELTQPTPSNEDFPTDDEGSVLASIPVAKPSLARKSSQKRKGKYHLAKFADHDELEINSFREGLHELVNEVMKTANSIVPHLQGKYKNQALKALHNSLYTLAETEELNDLVPGAVNKVYLGMGFDEQGGVDEKSVDELFALVDEFGEKVKAEIQEKCIPVKTALVNKNRLYQNCLGQLNKLGEKTRAASTAPSKPPLSSTATAHSEGLEALTEYIPTKDPFTKRYFKEIRVNQRCGHVYEYESVLNMMAASRRKGFKCPYAGCTNKFMVRLDDLKEDTEMARKIQERIEEEQNSSV